MCRSGGRSGGRGYGGRGFNGKCNSCGKQGHKKTDCWKLEENKDKRPNGYKADTEISAAAVDRNNDSIEYLITHVQVDHEDKPKSN